MGRVLSLALEAQSADTVEYNKVADKTSRAAEKIAVAIKQALESDMEVSVNVTGKRIRVEVSGADPDSKRTERIKSERDYTAGEPL